MNVSRRIENYLLTFFYVLGITGLFLIRIGNFHPAPQIVLSLLITIALLWSWKYISEPSTLKVEDENSISWFICLAAIFCIALFNSLFPACYMIGDRDPGLYLLFSAVISKTGSLNLNLPEAGQALTELGVLTTPGYPGIYDSVKHGFSNTPGELQPQFAHLFCAYGALLHRLFGVEGLIRTNAIIGLFAMLSFARVIKKLLPGWPVLAGILLFGLNPAFLWNSRQTLTETLSVFILFLSILLMISADRKHRGIILFAAGSVMASGILNRVDTLLNSVVVASFLIVSATKKENKATLALPVAFIIVTAIGLLDGFFFSGAYYQHLWKSETLKLLVILCVTILPVAIIIFSASTKNITIPIQGVNRVITAGAILLGLWLCIRYFPGETGPYENAKRAVQELGWYIFPLSYPLIIAGIHLAARDKTSKAWVPIVVTCGFTMFVFTWKPYAYPDHFWTSRRWLTHVIPLGTLVTLYALNKIQTAFGVKRRIIGNCIIVFFIICMTGNSMYVSRTFVASRLLKDFEKDLNKISAVLDDTPYGDYLISNAHQLAAYLTYVYDHPTIMLSSKGKNALAGKKNNELLNNRYFIGIPFYAHAQNLETISHFLVKGAIPEHAVARIPEKLDNRVYYYELGIIKSESKGLRPHNILAMDSRLETTSAGIKNYSTERITSTGKSGFMQYGPYMSLAPGKYKVSWKGSINTTSNKECGYADVTLEFGKILAAKIPVAYNENSPLFLASTVFEVTKPVKGAEFRLYANEDALIELEKITLTRVDL